MGKHFVGKKSRRRVFKYQGQFITIGDLNFLEACGVRWTVGDITQISEEILGDLAQSG